VATWRQALAELAECRAAALKRQAFLLCGNNAEADDLVQDALVRAFARPLRVPGPGDAETYVRAIMVHRFVDLARRRALWHRTVRIMDIPEHATDASDAVVLRTDLARALSGLSARQRACVVLRYYEDLPVAQIAETLRCSEGAVKRYLHEATSRLAAWLATAERD
jgi:RNA polymerase sigma-70 factor (sigma-E family)